MTGNPLRAPILGAARGYAAPKPGGDIRILVIGGSLGARLLSLTTPKAIALLPEALRRRLRVVQQTREENLDEVRALYDAAGVTAELSSFFTDMGALYADAHMVISRAGASSVSEIAAMGRPAIFVPLGIAMDDHQTANAAGLAEAGAALSIAEADFTAEMLSARLESALSDSEALSAQAEAARANARTDAHIRLADIMTNACGD